MRGIVGRWLLAILILPFNVLVLMPGVLLFVFRGGPLAHEWAPVGGPRFLCAALAALAALLLAAWTVGLFVRFGEGTAAPWDPPRRFVVRGPYRHVRNPMILSVFMMQAAEALFAWSLPLLGWLAAFVAANLFYIPLSEEPALERRFGADYLAFKREVPRWLPRLKAYTEER